MLQIRNAETRREIASISCFGLIFRGAWFVWGMVLCILLIQQFSPEIGRFLDPALREFWPEAAAYQANDPDAPDRAELEAKYGEEVVAEYLDSEATMRLVPSDKVQQVNPGTGDDGDELAMEDDFPLWLIALSGFTFIFPFLLLISYFPAASALRTLQLLAIRFVYIKTNRTQLVDSYMSALKHRRFHRVAYTYIITAGWCILQGLVMTLGRGELSLDAWFQQAGNLMATAYVGGLWLFALNLLVDAVAIFLGSNPLAHLWDELAVMLITIPIWIFVFQNSWMTALVIGLAGLGQVIMAKRIHQRLMAQSA